MLVGLLVALVYLGWPAGEVEVPGFTGVFRPRYARVAEDVVPGTDSLPDAPPGTSG